MAIVVAVMLKYFVVEAYQIPSGSMQPTLMGSPEARVFDRILVDKLSFHFRDPERFEVCVFKYPLDRSKSFIKRLVGMPGEDLRIEYGDVWTRKDASEPWKILRRPDPVQKAVWKHLDHADPRYAAWKPDSAARTWAMHGRAGFEARGQGSVRLPAEGESVRDSYFDGYPDSLAAEMKANPRRHPKTGQPMPYPPALNDVADVRVEGEIEAKANLKSFTIELREGERSYRFTIPGPASDGVFEPWKVTVPPASKSYPDQPDAKVTTNAPPGGGAPSDEPYAWRLPAGKRVSFAAQNMDDELRLEIDGKLVYAIDVPATGDQRSSVTLRFDGDADVSDVELYRDIYYTEGDRMLSEFHIPLGNYVFLGDNTQDSSDSREWKLAYYRWDGPGSNNEWVRGNLRELNENPTFVNRGGRNRIFFRDEWGELHDFLETPDVRGKVEPAPYVPRSSITGRAVLVFWPWWPLTPGFDSTRLKWIR